MKYIDERETTYISKGYDPVGNLFFYREKLYREINNDRVAHVHELFDSGLIPELISLKLFPKTTIAKIKKMGSDMILEHEYLTDQVYSHEWTFSMLKDAALTTLKVNMIAEKYGYQTIDAHTGNIVFSKNMPYFVDLGSFIKLPTGSSSWFAIEEFYKLFLYPLRLWTKGYEHLVASQLLRNTLTHSDYIYISFPLLSFFPRSLLDKLLFTYFLSVRITAIDSDALKEKAPTYLFKVYKLLKKWKLLPFSTVSFEKQYETIQSIENTSSSYWGTYQTNNSLSTSYRLKKIKTLVKKIKPNSIVDLASNQGEFALNLIQNTITEKAYCIDLDRNAIDVLYKKVRSKKVNILCFSENVIFPSCLDNQKSITKRTKSDLALALALTHHLLLTQNISFETIFNRLSRFTTDYLLVEYMPLGLWNGRSTVKIPDWYTQENFEKHLSKLFNIVEIHNLETNRILYVARLKEIL